jgi:hypothetical protein
MSKTLCKLGKHELEKLLPIIAGSLAECTHICRRCARVSTDKNRLCKPIAIRKLYVEVVEKSASSD